MYINKHGYLERRTRSGRRTTKTSASVRNWWLIKSNHRICCINVPSKYMGKRIRFKVTIEEVNGGN